MRRYDAIFLDAQGTLLQPDPSINSIYSEICLRFGKAVTDGEIAAATRELWADHRRSISREEHSYDTSEEATREWWAAFNARLFQQLGMRGDPEGFVAALWDVFGKPERWRLFPEVERVLATLRERGYRLGIVSNWDSRLLGICDNLGITPHMEFILASAPAGVEKPDPRIFQMALASAGVAPDRALHVGDDYEADVVGARSAGIDALWLDRDGQGQPENGSIRSLLELIDIL